MCLLALEEMTLTELNQRYFEDGGIGYTKRVIAGKATPVDFVMEAISQRFESKYQEAWTKEDESRKSYKGW